MLDFFLGTGYLASLVIIVFASSKNFAGWFFGAGTLLTVLGSLLMAQGLQTYYPMEYSISSTSIVPVLHSYSVNWNNPALNPVLFAIAWFTIIAGFGSIIHAINEDLKNKTARKVAG